MRNADGLAQLLSGFLGMKVRIEQFTGRWMPLPEAERSRIGRRGASRRLSTSQLGASACGPTALLDVLRLLGLAGPDTEQQVLCVVPARTRDYSALLM